MKAKYDIARLHKDCVAWCENPKWYPWLRSLNAFVHICDTFHLRINVSQNQIAAIPREFNDFTQGSKILLFAELAGLDVESYRLPEIDRDQAVRYYLDGIKEGAPLWEGSEWVKASTKQYTWARFTEIDDPILLMSDDKVYPIAYTFLRLDLRE